MSLIRSCAVGTGGSHTPEILYEFNSASVGARQTLNTQIKASDAGSISVYARVPNATQEGYFYFMGGLFVDGEYQELFAPPIPSNTCKIQINGSGEITIYNANAYNNSFTLQGFVTN